jgi:AraC-like DNA-binding protein
MQGRVEAFTIVFQPGGPFMLFSLPGEVLTNDHFEGQSALGRRLGELERQLGDVTSFDDRIRIANDYLCSKRPAIDTITATARAAAEVLSRSGCVRVGDLARSAGLGIRQFERRFQHEIGVSPKLYARIARFEAALRRKTATPEMRWTDIAHALEYHDQMHMVHDFNRLSGASPTAIGDQLDMFVQPELASADRSIPFSE